MSGNGWMKRWIEHRMNARHALLLLLWSLLVVWWATGNGDQRVIVVDLLEDGGLSLDGQPVPDAEFPGA